jgi:cell division protein FtsA
MVNKNICASGYRNRINAGMVITGGTALLANVVDMAEQIFDMPVRVGFPEGVGGRVADIESPRCTTGVGLVLYGAGNRDQGVKETGGVVGKLKGLVKSII